jgi:2-C-methyl-D-erythritol 4-phosphate cytidylyltransferase
MQPKRFALIVAGGSGLRMGSNIPKQFMELDGIPVLMRTISVFLTLKATPEVVLVLPETQIAAWQGLCKKHHFDANVRIAPGGVTRFESVKNGLEQLAADESLVAIHDGVRPLVTHEVVERCYTMAARQGCAIPAVQPVESVMVASSGKFIPFPRNDVLLVQTPQTFRAAIIKQCYNQPYSELFTDDASVAAACGVELHTVEGNRENIKITTPADLLTARALLQAMKTD